MRDTTVKSPRQRRESARVGLDRFLRDSLKCQWHNYRKEFKRCQKRFSHDGVHKVRIAIRRLMASLDLLESILPARPVHQARQLLKKRLKLFARLRDTHAQSRQVEKLRHTFPIARRYHAALDRRESRLVQRLRRRLVQAKDKRLTRRISVLKQKLLLLARNGAEEADQMTAVMRGLRTAFVEVKKRRRAIRADDTKTIHRTRIAFKRFRYMTEALEAWLPSISRRALKAMGDYQTRMGDIQDTEVLLTAVDKFISKQGGGSRRWSGFRAQLLRRRGRLVRRFVASADKFNGFLCLPSSGGGRTKKHAWAASPLLS